MKRTSFLAAGAAVVAASGAARAAPAPGGTDFVERAADFDAASFERQVNRPADIRQLFEAIAFKPAMWNNVKNALNGLQFGFGYPADRIAIAMALHGPSSVYNYSDAMWTKYRLGEYFALKNDAGATIDTNIYLNATTPAGAAADPDDDNGMYQDVSIAGLQRRGVLMMTCHTAVEEQARGIVKRGFSPAGMTAPQVADDILTHLIPGAIVVPAMVAAVAVLQSRYRYAYTTLTF